MTTHPPTGPDGAAVPAPGLPDEATLTRWANELFRALPGAGPAGPGDAAGLPAAELPGPPAVDRGARRLPGGGASVGAAPGAPSPASTVPSSPFDVPVRSVASPVGAGDLAGLPGAGPVPATAAPAAPVPATRPGAGPVPATATPATAASYYFLAGPRQAGVPATGLGLPAAAAAEPLPAASPWYVLAEPAGFEPRRDPTPAQPTGPTPPYDLHGVRRDFPILGERIDGKQVVWFDNAATTQKPRAVIDRLSRFYEQENSNVHRAAHALAARATDAYEHARDTVARFVGADAEEIVFVRGTTEAINLVASTWGRSHLGEGDELVISHLEHHANIVPWHLLQAERGFTIKVIPVDDRGQLRLDELTRLLSDRTRLVSVTHVSNALGTVTPIQEIVDAAHRHGARVLVDGAQSVAHLPVDVHALDVDFFAFSGHKIYGPTGIGVLYGKRAVLQDMPPYQGGGNMISDVTLERSLFQPPPGRFEAGTGTIADAVGLATALEYLTGLGLPNVARYEHELVGYATRAMLEVPGLTMIGTAPDKASVLSFVLDGYATAEVGRALSEEGIAVRSGHHCAQPILRRFGLETTVRPSLALYNTTDEVDHMVAVLHRLAGARRGHARTA